MLLYFSKLSSFINSLFCTLFSLFFAWKMFPFYKPFFIFFSKSMDPFMTPFSLPSGLYESLPEDVCILPLAAWVGGIISMMLTVSTLHAMDHDPYEGDSTNHSSNNSRNESNANNNTLPVPGTDAHLLNLGFADLDGFFNWCINRSDYLASLYFQYRLSVEMDNLQNMPHNTSTPIPGHTATTTQPVNLSPERHQVVPTQGLITTPTSTTAHNIPASQSTHTDEVIPNPNRGRGPSDYSFRPTLPRRRPGH